MFIPDPDFSIPDPDFSIPDPDFSIPDTESLIPDPKTTQKRRGNNVLVLLTINFAKL
jgi:hypothetical protein